MLKIIDLIKCYMCAFDCIYFTFVFLFFVIISNAPIVSLLFIFMFPYLNRNDAYQNRFLGDIISFVSIFFFSFLVVMSVMRFYLNAITEIGMWIKSRNVIKPIFTFRFDVKWFCCLFFSHSHSLDTMMRQIKSGTL